MNKYIHFLGLGLLIILITLVATHQALSFGFWRDDWLYVWILEVLDKPAFFEGLNLEVSYPINLARLVLLSKILEINPIGWQVMNLVFRSMVPFAAGLLIYGITHSFKAGIFTALFSAAGVAGIEPASFLGANNVTFFIIPLSTAFYFWITSLEKTGSKTRLHVKRYLLALVIFGILAKGEIWSYYLIPLMSIIWDFLYLVKERSTHVLKLTGIRVIILMLVLVAAIPLPPNPDWVARNSGTNKFKSLKIENFDNYLASIGGLSLGSLIYIPESGGLTSPTSQTILVGALILFVTISLGFIYLISPSDKKMVLLYLLCWMLLYYFPNWVFESTLTVGASHRYLAIAAVGFHGLLAYLVLRTSRLLAWVLVILFVLNNIYLSNKVLNGLGIFRSDAKIQNIVKSINSAIPKDQKDFMIFYDGDPLMRGYTLDWSLGIPIAIERGITKREEFPVWTGNLETVKKLLCGEKVAVSLIGTGEKFERGGTAWSKDQIHAFYVKDTGEVINNSLAIRERFNLETACLGGRQDD